jgi:signal transduction histidine kinase/ActR/RegA family two-component response regulator
VLRNAEFDWLTLGFPKDLEEEFRRDYARKSVLHVRIGLAFAIALWCLFGVLDHWIVPEVKEAAWAIRFAFVVPLLLLIFLFTFSSHYYRLAQPAAATAAMISALGLIAMVNLVIRPAGAHPYTSGLLLSVPCICVVWRLRFVNGVWATLATVLADNATAVGFTEIPLPVMLNNNFFLVSSGILGLLAGYNMETYIRRDFLQRRAAERSVEQLELASLARSRFLAAASHDLRQPLHTLSLYSASLKLHASDGAVGEIALHINKALASLSALVDSLLDISKLDAGAVQPETQNVSLRTIIERIEADYRPVANGKGLEFHVAAPDLLVETDPVLLERLVRNLVDNAFKYTAAGNVTLAAEMDGGMARVSVRDTGPGIPVAERDRIFEEFYQIGNPERDRVQGLGLGLAIVQRLAQLLGLTLTLESEPGCGSTFTVTIPPATERRAFPRAPAGQHEEASRALEGARILVIDDESDVRAGMRSLLERLGCTVSVCSGYADAERLIDQDGLEDVHLIVSDFRLRAHESGIDTVRRLRERLGNVPALLVSGDTAPERLREARSSGLPLLHKPVSAEKLTEAILAALRG